MLYEVLAFLSSFFFFSLVSPYDRCVGGGGEKDESNSAKKLRGNSEKENWLLALKRCVCVCVCGIM